MSPPLILTALLDDAVQARLDALRRAHFPPERNHLAAHLTLFHALPGDEEAAITRDLAAAAAREPVAAEISGVRMLGRGVAFVLTAPALTAMRAGLAAGWTPWLTPQDRQKRDLHVTVQNKVSPDTARALHTQLSAGFVPEPVTVTGLGLWRYLGGPWEPVTTFRFRPG